VSEKTRTVDQETSGNPDRRQTNDATSFRVVTSLDDLQSFRTEWEQLERTCFRPNVFQSWNWTIHWLRLYLGNNGLLCIIAYDKDIPVAIAPLWVERVRFGGMFTMRVLQFIGSKEICADYLDFLIAPRRAPEQTKRIWDHLFGPLRKEWDVFQYHDVPGQSPSLSVISELTNRDERCVHTDIETFTVCPYIELPDSQEEFIAGLNSKQRKNLKTAELSMRKLGEVTLTRCSDTDQVDATLNELIELHQSWWRERGERGSFASDRFREFHRQITRLALEDGTLGLSTLRLDNETIGICYGFVYEGTAFGYIHSVTKVGSTNIGVGRVLMARCIEQAIEAGCHEFDLLRGAEQYKYYWTDKDRRNLSLTLYNRRPKAFLRLFTRFVGRYSKELIRSVLGKHSQSVKRWVGR
jgi:CelD/BcsL family acetyltransferase involved in cellulose biosynthesis